MIFSTDPGEAVGGRMYLGSSMTLYSRSTRVAVDFSIFPTVTMYYLVFDLFSCMSADIGYESNK